MAAVAPLFIVIVLFVRTGKSANGPPPVMCQPRTAANLHWPSASGLVEFPCGSVYPTLNGGVVTRVCEEGTWSDIDFTGCLLPPGTAPFVLLWFSVNTTSDTVKNSSTQLLTELYAVMDLDSVSEVTAVNLTVAGLKTLGNYPNTAVLISMAFPAISAPNSTLQAQINNALSRLNLTNSLGPFVILQLERGYSGFYIAASCPCRPSEELFDGHCSGAIPVSPCVPNMGPSGGTRCRSPEFVGDGVYCATDIDEDGYPADVLQSCSSTSTKKFCIKDNCPMIHNPDQRIFACLAPPNFEGCPLEMGRRIGIVWGNTERGSTAVQPCPRAVGFVSRYCTEAGVWAGEEDVSQCRSYDFSNAFTSAREIFRLGESVGQRLSMVTSVIDSVASLTVSDTYSLLPTDLESTNEVIEELLDLLEESLTSDNETDDDILTMLDIFCSDIFSNVLDATNLDGWLELTETGEGTPRLLDNIERYSLYVSQRPTTTTTRRVWMRSNFALSFMRRPQLSSSSVIFPSSVADLQGSLDLDYIPAQVELPNTLFDTRGGMGGRPPQLEIPSSIFLVRNMEFAMPLMMEGGGNASSIPSMIVSAQVDERGSSLPDIEDNPVKIMFQFDKVDGVADDQYRCAFWKFSDPIGDGYWAFDGVQKTSISMGSDGRMEVHCTATHLTSFAVLVDVAGSTTNNDGPSSTEIQALMIVSYIGCVISVVFLIITIIFFLFQGRDLLVKMHYFLHLNLAITLCLAYVLFLVGGPTAIAIKEACVAVAVVMHYLFLSSFCWMLCEGVMLYLLLVVVFSNVSRKPWLFLLVGYALPVVPVVVSVGVRHDTYGVTNEDGNLTFCWLSTENGLIWAFVGPMLLVILVNLVFLCLALYKVFSTKRKRSKSSQLTKKFSNKNLVQQQQPPEKESQLKKDLELVRTLAMSVVVLLPVLGLTWVLGVIAVNRNTTVFAWLFTIINSLQGFFIFFFHVVRSDKVWKNPHAVRFRSKLSISRSTKDSSLRPPSSFTSSTDFRSTSRNTLKTTSITSQYMKKPASTAEVEKAKEAWKEEEAGDKEAVEEGSTNRSISS